MDLISPDFLGSISVYLEPLKSYSDTSLLLWFKFLATLESLQSPKELADAAEETNPSGWADQAPVFTPSQVLLNR